MFLSFSKRILLTMALIAVIATAGASDLTSLPVKKVNGTSYHVYNVKQHETVYALSRRFDVSEDEIFRLNPSARNGIKAGQELLLPFSGKQTATTTYVVKKQETAYGISKRFGMTLEEFFALNPETRDGVQEGQTVKIGKSAASTTATSPAQPATKVKGKKHILAESETLYQIARSNNISLAQLLAANPSLDAARYTAGTEIIIPETADAPEASTTQAVSTPKGNTYTVKTGDTFYGIASRNGIELARLREANPGVEILQEGMTITIPQAAEKPLQASVATDAPEKVTVAVVLPFQLNQKAKHNKNMVEFYRGFLLAVDTMRNAGLPLHILTFDTNGTDEGLEEVLSDPKLKQANAIVAPDNAAHIARLNKFGRDNKIAVINVFNNRDTTYMNNPYAMQAALPRDDMYDRASKAFIESFSDYTPVFLVSSDGRKDKMEFIDIMRQQLKAAGRDYKEITYKGTLTANALSPLGSTKKYAFLPASSNKEEFDKIAKTIQEYKNGHDFTTDVVVWGYPEWLANRSAIPAMHELDCYIYSRNDYPDSFASDDVNELYAKWYGPGMLTAYPRRAYMGYDTGMYLLKSLSVNGGDFNKYSPYVSGLAIPMTFKQTPEGGWINNELLLINLAPGEFISKRSI